MVAFDIIIFCLFSILQWKYLRSLTYSFPNNCKWLPFIILFSVSLDCRFFFCYYYFNVDLSRGIKNWLVENKCSFHSSYIFSVPSHFCLDLYQFFGEHVFCQLFPLYALHAMEKRCACLQNYIQIHHLILYQRRKDSKQIFFSWH